MMKTEAFGDWKTHDYYMNAAVAEARKSMTSGDGNPFGAVIVRNGEIIARGRNRIFIDNDPTAHSEILAIRQACKKLKTLDLSGCTIYASSEPCPMCMAAIYYAGIKQIYYTTNVKEAASYGFAGGVLKQLMANEFKNSGIKTKSINKEDGIQIFKEWKQFKVNNYLK